MRILRDERGIVVNWLVKLLIGFAVVGLVIFDTGAILANYFGLDSAANEIANEISLDVLARTTGTTDNEIVQAAKPLAKEHGARLISAEIDEEGIIKIELRRKADTLVVSRVSWFEDWGVATADGQSGTKPQ